MGLRPCSGNCLARVIGGVVGTRGGPGEHDDNAVGVGRRHVPELRRNCRGLSSSRRAGIIATRAALAMIADWQILAILPGGTIFELCLRVQ